MHLSTWLTFLAATIVVMIAPGPSVTLMVANSLRHGRRAGLANVAGFQAGFAIMVVLTLAGLASLIAAMGEWFVWVRLLGAAYVVFLGVRLILGRDDAHGAVPRQPPRGGYFAQAMMVEVSNPKALLFFGAFFPSSSIPPPARPCRSSSWGSPPWRSPQSPIRWSCSPPPASPRGSAQAAPASSAG